MPGWMMPLVIAAILGIATFTDLRWRRVPLWLTLGGTGVAVLRAALTSWDALGVSLLGLAVGQCLLLPFVLRGGFGAGDALLLGTVGAWGGAPFVLWTATWTAVVGAGLAVFTLWRGQKTFAYVPAIGLGAALAFLLAR